MNENNIRFGVVLLSAGTGSRMNSDIPKQYIVIEGHPVLYYSLYDGKTQPGVWNLSAVGNEKRTGCPCLYPGKSDAGKYCISCGICIGGVFSADLTFCG